MLVGSVVECREVQNVTDQCLLVGSVAEYSEAQNVKDQGIVTGHACRQCSGVQ